MRITVDTERSTLALGDQEWPLSSAEAFRTLAQLWLTEGWRAGHWTSFSWLGQQLVQLPDDALRLAEAVWRLQPDVVIETGLYEGGSALLVATVCEMNGNGRVVSIEKELRAGVRDAIVQRGHGRITILEGDSTEAATAHAAAGLIQPGDIVFVFLDSDHTREHVARELALYAPLVTTGSYLVVADTILPEVKAAVDEFLAAHAGFRQERPLSLYQAEADFTQLSYFAAGWLKRV
jgi:cephalosporin hydroxylase